MAETLLRASASEAMEIELEDPRKFVLVREWCCRCREWQPFHLSRNYDDHMCDMCYARSTFNQALFMQIAYDNVLKDACACCGRVRTLRLHSSVKFLCNECSLDR